MEKRKLAYSISLICIVIGSLYLIYPEQTEEVLIRVHEWWTIDPLPMGTEFWRIRTQNAMNNTDIKVDYCYAERNGTGLGEPAYYRTGYVEFNSIVSEKDTITIRFYKSGFVRKSITFIVPTLYPVGGQTYYIFAIVKLIPREAV